MRKLLLQSAAVLVVVFILLPPVHAHEVYRGTDDDDFVVFFVDTFGWVDFYRKTTRSNGSVDCHVSWIRLRDLCTEDHDFEVYLEDGRDVIYPAQYDSSSDSYLFFDKYEQLVAECDEGGDPFPGGLYGDYMTALDDILGYCDFFSFYGGAGSDSIHGTPFDDNIYLESGDDAAYGGGDMGTVQGAGDYISGSSGSDHISCGNSPYGTSSCTVWGGTGDDHILGGPGPDVLFGQNDDDYLRGDPGHRLDGEGDYIHGGSGDDRILGMAGADTITGSSGNDWISSGMGEDRSVSGGSGTDTFACRVYDNSDPAQDDNDRDTRSDCSAMTIASGVEHFAAADPYVEWADVALASPKPDAHGFINNPPRIFPVSLTTSSPRALARRHAGGAALLFDESPSIPLSGRFCRPTDSTFCPRSSTDLAAFLPDSGEWVFDITFDGDNSTTVEQNLTLTGYGRPGDRPFAYDVNDDGTTDIGFFRPGDMRVYIDYARSRTYPSFNGYSNVVRTLTETGIGRNAIPFTGRVTQRGADELLFYDPDTGYFYTFGP